MMEVEQQTGRLSAATALTALLDELGAVTDYRTLRDTLPRRLARLLHCRCVILYQSSGDTLQFASGSFDDQPGWSGALLAVTHINPISVQSNTLEAQAWRQRKAVTHQAALPSHIAAPLLYRMRDIGVLVAIRGDLPSASLVSATHLPTYWTPDEAQIIEAIAGVVAMLLENTRLLEHDRDRIQELSLLNSISRQFHASLYNRERAYSLIVQCAREISAADLCDCIIPGQAPSSSAWLSSTLQELLLRHLRERKGSTAAPLIIERPGDTQSSFVLEYLDPSIKTLFAIPLWSGSHKEGVAASTQAHASRLSGVIVGGYRRPWKLRREEMVLLNVLATQAGSLIENITLVAEVIEARNEARKLLRQVLEDQRQQERIEEEKRRLDRLAALGAMAANVAHEVRNPLASIKTSMQILIDDLIHEPAGQLMSAAEADCISAETQESVSIVLKEVERLDAIVRDLLQFARPSQLHCVRCSLAEISDRVLRMLDKQYREAGIAVQRMYRDTPTISVDIAQIEQVLLNLCLNALQAMPQGGKLTLSMQCARHSNTLPDSSSSTSSWLELAVNDTGIGITPEQQERIFQPFFTTKAHGIGLGLSISRRLVEDHQGQLVVESQSGSGSTFIMRLPLDDLSSTARDSSDEEEDA